MKVHHITTVSGSLVFLRGQLRFFRKQGLEVYVTSRPDTQLDEFAEAEGAQAIAVPMNRQISPVADIVSVFRLVRIMRRHKPEIVHAHTPKGGVLGTIAARIARVPIVIYHIRGLPYMEMQGKKRTLMKTTERISCLFAHRVFCVSHSIAEVAIRDKLVPADKIKVFLRGSGNGVDSNGRFNPENASAESSRELRELYGIPQDAVVVLFVGRLAADKGIQELATAWKTLARNHPSARLILVGTADERDPVPDSVVEDLRAEPSVILAGAQAETENYYAAADIVVLPTYREGFPNVLLEASSMRLPIVATRIPGCTDAVEEGVTGTLVPSRDAARLQDALEDLIVDEAKRWGFGRAGRDRIVQGFDSIAIWSATYEEYLRLARVRGMNVSSVEDAKVSTVTDDEQR